MDSSAHVAGEPETGSDDRTTVRVSRLVQNRNDPAGQADREHEKAGQCKSQAKEESRHEQRYAQCRDCRQRRLVEAGESAVVAHSCQDEVRDRSVMVRRSTASSSFPRSGNGGENERTHSQEKSVHR